MRVWIDLTNSPHVLVMRPVIELLREDGHEVRVTARDFAQTLGLLERLGIEHDAIGHHRGEGLLAKAGGLASRSAALLRWAARQPRPRPVPVDRTGSRGSRRRRWRAYDRPFDIALGHGSNDVSVAARLLGIPCSTMFDYEWAAVQHHLNCRLAQAVVVPDAIPAQRLYRYGARGKVRAYEGLKEEYYLADFQPSDAVLGELGLRRERPIVVVRTPPEVSLYHRFENDLFSAVLDRLRLAAAGGPGPAGADAPDPFGAGGPGPAGAGGDAAGAVQVVVLPRTGSQRAELRQVPGFVVPERAIDAQSLIAFADLMISAGGTMNREAVALGTPVYTTFEGRLGALDERLLSEGRLRRLTSAEQLSLNRRAVSPPSARETAVPSVPGAARSAPVGGAVPDARASGERVRRDPRVLLELLLSPLSLRST